MHPAFINNVFAGKAIDAFCWMLIHSLWQGLLFTIVTGLVMMFTKKSGAALRYNIMCALFFLFVAVCAGTFIWQLNSGAQQAAGLQGSAVAAENNIQQLINKFTAYFSANASIIVMGWFIVFFAKCVKMMASLVYSQRVRHHKTHQPPAYWKTRIAELCEQLQVKRVVQLLESEIVKIPVVIGHLKPIVFIPVGLLTNMPAGEIEAVLLHELAHIRRNDYFVNVIQVVAENIFFFNPALLWMSSLLREERENCCDDVAVAQTKSKKQFIQALISFKEHALHTTNYTTAFPAKKNQLLQRVTRIINNRNKTLNPVEKLFFAGSFLLLAVLSLAMTNAGVATVTKKTAQQPVTSQNEATVIMPPVQAKAAIDDVKHYVIDNEEPAPGNEEPAPPGNSIAAIYKEDAKITAKHNPQVIEYYSKTIKIDNKKLFDDDKDKVEKPENHELTADQQQALRDQQQAIRDQQQAVLDQQQAEEDQKQAIKDQEQARLDEIQAERDRVQAEEDRKQAIRDKGDDKKQKKQPAQD
jgi:bla regulator protein BlaR1